MNTRRLFDEIVRLRRRVVSLETNVSDNTGFTYLSSSIPTGGLYSGNTLIAGTGSHSEVVAGHLVYLDSTKQWKRTHAALTATGGGNVAGISLSTSPHIDGVLVNGLYNLPTDYVSGSSGVFSIGSQVYMSPEASGSFTTTIPSGSGQIVRVVGHSVDSDMIYFAPSPDYIEI